MKAYGPGNMLLINLNVFESIGDTKDDNERISLNKKLKGACSNFFPLILAISFNLSFSFERQPNAYTVSVGKIVIPPFSNYPLLRLYILNLVFLNKNFSVYLMTLFDF